MLTSANSCPGVSRRSVSCYNSHVPENTVCLYEGHIQIYTCTNLFVEGNWKLKIMWTLLLLLLLLLL